MCEKLEVIVFHSRFYAQIQMHFGGRHGGADTHSYAQYMALYENDFSKKGFEWVVEKAHGDVFNILLQIFDDGRINFKKLLKSIPLSMQTLLR